MRFARFNPLRDSPRKRDTLVWGLFETANHSFTLLIITLLFPIYFQDVVVGDNHRGKELWGIIYGISSAIIVILSPLVGTIADARGIKRHLLGVTAITCILATAGLAFVGPGDIALTAVLFIIGNISFVLGENLIAAFLPQLSTPKTVGRISAFGWAMGYAGGVVILALAAALMMIFHWESSDKWRPLFFLAAGWFMLISLPTLVFLRDTDPPADPEGKTNLLTIGFVRLKDTIMQGRRFAVLARFFAIFLLYSTVVQTIIAFGGTIAKSYGLNQVKLVMFVFVLTIVTLIGAYFTGSVQDRIGSVRTLLIALGIWLVTCIGLVIMPAANGPEWAVWVLGNSLGLGMGMIGTASRATVGMFTPKEKTSEFFGLWGLTLKVAGAIGPPIFGMVQANIGDKFGYGLLGVICIIAGFLLVFLIDEKAGILAAHGPAGLAGASPTSGSRPTDSPSAPSPSASAPMP